MTTQNDDDLILAGLTEEERAALAEPDDEDTTATQGDLEDAAKAAGTTTEGNDDDEDDKGAPAGAAAAAGDDGAAAANADDGKGAAAADEQGAAPSTAAQQAPILVAQAPADADAKLADIATKKEELDTKFDDGDITNAEYRKELDALNKQEREIELAQSKAQIAADMERQRLQNQWNADCNSFIAKHKDTYDGEANAEAFAHLNETVVAYAKMARNAGLSGPELLEKAHKAVMVERGMPVADTPKPGTKPAKAAAPKPSLPPDMSRIPAATGNDPGEGRWASLDKLADSNPAAFEAALAKMPEAERDEYLKA